jgi:hypothetical protein
MEVQPYRPDLAQAWNALNRGARNGHFMFDRGFMDYHADRFVDASLLVLKAGVPVALIPASRSDDEVCSHGGLTFGGLVTDHASTADVMAMLDLCADHWARSGARALVYKALPWIYARAPAQEDLYWLFRREAALFRRDVSTAIDYRAPGPVSSRRARGARKAASAGLSFGRSNDWSGFWALLTKTLESRHGVAPVHTADEIQSLATTFPEEITLHVAERTGEMLAGVVMFRSAHVAHAQYIAVGEAGRAVGALDGLFDQLIGAHSVSCRYFDFGISNTDQGRVLNEGLAQQKEEFGGSAVVHDFYRVALHPL